MVLLAIVVVATLSKDASYPPHQSVVGGGQPRSSRPRRREVGVRGGPRQQENGPIHMSEAILIVLRPRPAYLDVAYRARERRSIDSMRRTGRPFVHRVENLRVAGHL